MNNLGMPIIGLGARRTEHEMLPLQWMPHIQVADVATSVGHALRLGGSELMHGKDNDGKSQWAVLLDPNAAAFGIIPVVSAEELSASDGAASRNQSTPVGRVAWLDLTVSDATATRDFYRLVVGWTAKDVEMMDASKRYADYTMLGDDGNAAAGVCHARGVNLDVRLSGCSTSPLATSPKVSVAYRRKGVGSSRRSGRTMERTHMRCCRIQWGYTWRWCPDNRRCSIR
jgi:predicted enzyme related to lactoylglutathione lyase